MRSSAIRHLFYRPETEELSIWFAPDGRRYKFFGVPAELATAFREAASRGAFFNQSIRGRFPSERIDERPQRRRATG